ncbi:hypothetical protein KR074_003915 [Drosophila pseudoananassae]|nr:hypothetical protein KR074_003915 [Drosophila pseudoananassae]
MFLAKSSSTALRPKLFSGAVSMLRISQRLESKCPTSEEEKNKCFKFRGDVCAAEKKPQNTDCAPAVPPKPKYYKQLDPCKTDKELAVQHPKYLGIYPRCKIPYHPEPWCTDPCLLEVRMDPLYYKPSAALDKKYECYWVECFQRRPKRCCRRVPPERSYRVVYNKCDHRTQKKQCFMVDPMPCKQDAQYTSCPKFVMCNCPLANQRVDCLGPPKLRPRCRRPPTQYPCFSECQHEELSKPRPIECRCLEVPSTCELYRYMKRTRHRRGPCDPVDKGYDPCDPSTH